MTYSTRRTTRVHDAVAKVRLRMTLEEMWTRKSDNEVLVATARLYEYSPLEQQAIGHEVLERGLLRALDSDDTVPADGTNHAPSMVENDSPPRRIGSERYVLATVACAAILLLYWTVAFELGWTHG